MDTKLLFGLAAVLLVAFGAFIFADSSNRAGAYAGTQATADCGPGGCAAHALDDSALAGANSNTGANAADLGAGGAAGANLQSVSLRATRYGYDKATITVKAGVPVKFDFSAEQAAGCGRQLLIDNVGVNLVSRNGETVSAIFTPPAAGNYAYHCGMNMFRGTLIAT